MQPQQRTGFECERPLPGPSGVDAVDSQKYQLMDEAVETTTFGPLYHVSFFICFYFPFFLKKFQNQFDVSFKANYYNLFKIFKSYTI